MPHQCVKCSAMYADGSQEILKGCACGSSAFLYLRIAGGIQLPQETREQILAQEKPIILDVESIKISADGKYELDLQALFGKDNLIYKEQEGKYTIDLEESFRRHARK
jgi:uncharacterized protein